MVFRESLAQLGAIQLQLRKRLLDLHGAIQDGLSLDRQIDAALLQLERLDRGLARIDVILDERKLFLEEFERFRCFRALALDVLPHIRTRDRIQDFGNLLGILAFERHSEDSGLFPLLADAQLGLQIVDHTRPTPFGDAELRTRACNQLGDEDFDPPVALTSGSGLPDVASDQRLALGPLEREVLPVTRNEAKRLIQQLVWDLQARDPDALSAPGEAGQTEQWRRNSVVVVPAIEGAPKHGERAGPRLHREIELIDDRAEQRARTNDLDLRVRGRLLTEHRREVIEARDALCLVFHLQEDIGAIGWMGEKQVHPREHARTQRDEPHEQAILDDCPDVLREGGLVVAELSRRWQRGVLPGCCAQDAVVSVQFHNSCAFLFGHRMANRTSPDGLLTTQKSGLKTRSSVLGAGLLTTSTPARAFRTQIRCTGREFRYLRTSRLLMIDPTLAHPPTTTKRPPCPTSSSIGSNKRPLA